MKDVPETVRPFFISASLATFACHRGLAYAKTPVGTKMSLVGDRATAYRAWYPLSHIFGNLCLSPGLVYTKTPVGTKMSLIGDRATASGIRYPTSPSFRLSTLSSYPCSSFPIPTFQRSFLLPWVFQ